MTSIPVRVAAIALSLERFSFPYSDAIAAVPDVVRAFDGGEELERDPDQQRDLVEGPRAGGAQERFELRKHELDRIEIGTVRGQELEPGAGRFDRGADLRWLMHGQVVEHDDIAGTQGRDEDLLDVGEKTHGVDRPIEHAGGGELVPTERGDHGAGLPVPKWRVIPQPRAAGTATVAADQIRGDAAFIDKDVLAGVVERQPVAPAPTLSDDGGAPLFVREDRFF